MKTSIKNCTLKDFDSIMNLLQQLWPEADLNMEKMLKVYRKGLRSKNQRYLKAEIDGKTVGFCSLSRLNSLYGYGELLHVDELVIDESFRGKGIGKLFMEKVFQISNEIGCTKVELESALHRHMAHRFYENLGFQKLGFVLVKQL